MQFKTKPQVVEAHRWFKNGDHPRDDVWRPFEDTGASPTEPREGAVVRYYRSPSRNLSTCPVCHSIWNAHGFLDVGDGGDMVCPGDWIVRVDETWKVVNPSEFAKFYEPVAELPKRGLIEAYMELRAAARQAQLEAIEAEAISLVRYLNEGDAGHGLPKLLDAQRWQPLWNLLSVECSACTAAATTAAGGVELPVRHLRPECSDVPAVPLVELDVTPPVDPLRCWCGDEHPPGARCAVCGFASDADGVPQLGHVEQIDVGQSGDTGVPITWTNDSDKEIPAGTAVRLSGNTIVLSPRWPGDTGGGDGPGI